MGRPCLGAPQPGDARGLTGTGLPPNLEPVCGRFSVTGDLDFYADYFAVDGITAESLPPSWNVAPTDRVYVIAEREGRRLLESMTWGLVPHWAPDQRTIHINARAETVATAPVFRDSFARRRCLIPADGFYEWEPADRGRTPHWISRRDGHPMVFAGIWATRPERETGPPVRTGCIVTTAAAGVVAPIHDRMPVVLAPEVWGPWLDRHLTDSEAAASLLRPIDPDLLMEHVVSPRVNSVRNNGPELRQASVEETLF